MYGQMMQQPLLISSLIVHAERHHGNRKVVSRRVEGDIHRATYLEIAQRSRQVAQALGALGVQAGERVATLAWNGYRHMELYCGISGLGAVMHTVNPRLHPDQITYIADHAEDQVMCFDLAFWPLIQAVAGRTKTIKHWVPMCDRTHLPADAAKLPSLLCCEDLRAAQDGRYAWPEFDENTASSLCHTSGTAGNPKGVLYSHRSTVLHALAAALPDCPGVGATDGVLPVVPMFHVDSWGIVYLAPMTGAKLVLPGPGLDGCRSTNCSSAKASPYRPAAGGDEEARRRSHQGRTAGLLPGQDRQVVDTRRRGLRRRHPAARHRQVAEEQAARPVPRVQAAHGLDSPAAGSPTGSVRHLSHRAPGHAQRPVFRPGYRPALQRATESCMRLMFFMVPLLAAATASATAAAPPVAEVKDMPTTYHGITVPDPYRWLEDSKSAPAQTWLKGQGAAARSMLDRIDGRDAIAQRLMELADAQGDAVGSLMRLPGERYYYLKRKVGEKQFKLLMRQGLSGAERVLVDPEAETARTGVPHAINYYKPSWDGKYLAYGMSAGGSEDASLYVMDIKSGKLLGAPVPRVYDVGVHWLPDSRSYTYTQSNEMQPGQPAVETYMDARVLWQRLGAAQAQAVFGPTVTPQLGLVRLDMGQLLTVPGSRWVVARTTDTTVPEGKLFALRLVDLGQPNARWQRLATEADKVVEIALQGDHLYVMTQAGAPRRKVVRIDLNKPVALAQATVVAAEPKDGALQGFDLTPTALVAQLRQGTSVLLRRYARGDTAGRNRPAPAPGTAWLTGAPAQDSETLLYVFSSWTEPTRWLRLENGRSTDVAFGVRRLPAGLPEVVVTDVNVESHDGMKVPMPILHKKGLALDGRNPVLLDGYASYGFSTSAYFSTSTMAWIERGGVAAFINPRGSGVHGDEWHRAGFKTTKPNTWKDGIAGAKYLIAKGYGSAKTMGITGTSAGGIFVGRAVTEAPELFAAAIFNVGLMDTVRAEESANGVTNISEFGTVKDPAEFKALLEMSTYHAVKDGTAYPGVMLVHGMNDPRVDVWQSGKTAARLQAAQAGLPDPSQARPTLLRLDAQAGHGMGSTHTQRQALAADMQSFLLWQMGKLGLKD
jgi:prolyl oligopeptidase